MFKTNPVLLEDLLKQVEDGRIQLPDFQRGWVWDDGRICGLLASISKGFPIGAVMTLAADADIRFSTRPIEGARDAERAPEHFLLDGQQRLTSLYQAMLHEGPVDTKDHRGKKVKCWYYVDMRKAMDSGGDREDAIFSVRENRKRTRDFGREITLDLSKPEFEYENHMMPTERLLDYWDWSFGYVEHWQNNGAEHPESNAHEFFNRFKKSLLDTFIKKYQLPVIELTKETPKEAVCTIFEKVNTGGVTLNVFELLTASLAADNFSLRDDWNARKKRLDEHSGTLQGVSPEQFLQVVALLATQERRREAMGGRASGRLPGVGCKKRDILELTLQEYTYWAGKVEDGFKKTAGFLLEQNIFRGKDVPYGAQLVPLAALYVELGQELRTGKAKSRLERWYWSGVFGEVYGGPIETLFALDLTEVARYVREDEAEEPSLVREASFIPERLLSLRTRNSAAYKGLYALQMKNGAADWLTGSPIHIGSIWNERNIDIHHIFPKSWCKKTQISPNLYNSVINKTPIDAETNRKIGGEAPSKYLLELKDAMDDEEKLAQVLSAHWVDRNYLRTDQFKDFFVERGEAMLELIGEAMGKPIPSGREVFRNALGSSSYDDGYDDGDMEHDGIGAIMPDSVADKSPDHESVSAETSLSSHA